MVVEYIRYRISSEKQNSFLEAYSKAASALDDSEYCLGYELSHCEEEPDRFILRIEWTSTEDHLGKFRSSPEFRAFLPHIRPYINDIEEMQHYQLTQVVS
ncbi:MAG: antibiotic biosynthesis monooxygenase family protein [Ardenticatenaceae bacterium]|nr:antibiotic biosynthesis monooxygenase family protein [Ardenticatenaceae bacterium]